MQMFIGWCWQRSLQLKGDVVPENRARRERSENANIAKQDDINQQTQNLWRSLISKQRRLVSQLLFYRAAPLRLCKPRSFWINLPPHPTTRPLHNHYNSHTNLICECDVTGVKMIQNRTQRLAHSDECDSNFLDFYRGDWEYYINLRKKSRIVKYTIFPLPEY